MVKKIRILAVFAVVAVVSLGLNLTTGFVSTAVSQTKLPEAIIAVVDINHILKVSDHAKVALKEINGKLKTVDDALKKRSEELQKKKQEIDKQRAIISPEVYRKKLEQLNGEFQSLQRDAQVTRANFNQIMQTYRLYLREQITRQAAAVSKERGVNIGMDRAKIIFFDNASDITEEVLARFNKSKPNPLNITVDEGKSATPAKKN